MSEKQTKVQAAGITLRTKIYFTLVHSLIQPDSRTPGGEVFRSKKIKSQRHRMANVFSLVDSRTTSQFSDSVADIGNVILRRIHAG
jgi:hypothetical protein